jgi:branched-subunit amino acid transport protein AzlD
MTAVQMGLTIAVCTAATMLTRFLPFVVFSSKDQQPPEVVRYLGRVLPAAIFGMLIVYCLKSVTPFAGSRRRWCGIWAGCCPPPSLVC